jgi:predicted component of type VI protein secretion system
MKSHKCSYQFLISEVLNAPSGRGDKMHLHVSKYQLRSVVSRNIIAILNTIERREF